MSYIFKTFDGGLIEINRTGEPNETLWCHPVWNEDYHRGSVYLKFKIFGFYILK
jgi:hypothetical protein